MRLPPVGAELLYRTDGKTETQTHRRTDLTKLLIAFCNYTSVPKSRHRPASILIRIHESFMGVVEYRTRPDPRVD
jgi:hypothetical protein